MIYLQFMVLSSVVLLFSVFLTPTVNFFMGLGVYIVGVMASMTETLANRRDGERCCSRASTRSSTTVIPNFDKFNITNTLLHPETHITNMARYTRQVTLYAPVLCADDDDCWRSSSSRGRKSSDGRGKREASLCGRC